MPSAKYWLCHAKLRAPQIINKRATMSASPIARQACSHAQLIPSMRKVLISDPSQMPDVYSSTPNGTIYGTTPGGNYWASTLEPLSGILSGRDSVFCVSAFWQKVVQRKTFFLIKKLKTFHSAACVANPEEKLWKLLLSREQKNFINFAIIHEPIFHLELGLFTHELARKIGSNHAGASEMGNIAR